MITGAPTTLLSALTHPHAPYLPPPPLGCLFLSCHAWPVACCRNISEPMILILREIIPGAPCRTFRFSIMSLFYRFWGFSPGSWGTHDAPRIRHHQPCPPFARALSAICAHITSLLPLWNHVCLVARPAGGPGPVSLTPPTTYAAWGDWDVRVRKEIRLCCRQRFLLSSSLEPTGWVRWERNHSRPALRSRWSGKRGPSSLVMVRAYLVHL